jgi:DNA-binding NarL/FixJ family response regulator
MTSKIRLLIIEEHKAVRHALETRLRSSLVVEVISAIPRVPDGVLNGSMPNADVTLLSVELGKNRQSDVVVDMVQRLVRWGAAVIVLTPYADDVERELLLHAGASRYLLKNVNTPQLIAEIEQVNTERAMAASLVL